MVVSGAGVVVDVVEVVISRLPAESSVDGSVIGLSDSAEDSSEGLDDESAFSTVSFFSSTGGAGRKFEVYIEKSITSCVCGLFQKLNY